MRLTSFIFVFLYVNVNSVKQVVTSEIECPLPFSVDDKILCLIDSSALSTFANSMEKSTLKYHVENLWINAGLGHNRGSFDAMLEAAEILILKHVI